MTSSIRALHILAYTSGYTSWVYHTDAPFTTTTQPGYFNAMHDMMAQGDTITIVAQDGTIDPCDDEAEFMGGWNACRAAMLASGEETP